jgi:hypothetical protein
MIKNQNFKLPGASRKSESVFGCGAQKKARILSAIKYNKSFGCGGQKSPRYYLRTVFGQTRISPTTKRGLKLPTIRLAEVGDGEVPD